MTKFLFWKDGSALGYNYKNETFLKFNNPKNWSTMHITFQSNTLIVFKKK